jgi:hypothetical protein
MNSQLNLPVLESEKRDGACKCASVILGKRKMGCQESENKFLNINKIKEGENNGEKKI